MAFKKVEPNVFKFEKEGDLIEGTLIKVDDSTKYEKNKVYHIEDKEKKIWVVFGTTIMIDRLSYAKIGDRVRIVYDGIDQNKKGQDTKLFSVYIDQK